jgi:carbonic anhydrase
MAAGGMLAAGLVATASCEEREKDEPPPRTAEDARKWLEAGNRRFVEGKTRHAHESANWRRTLASGQHPIVTLLCCSDSRVPPELVFDQGLGELFVIRVAGNVIATDVVGSIEYAVRHLKTPLVVVMGHEGCGAVTAALAALEGKTDEPRELVDLIERIEPAIENLPGTLQGEARLHAAVESNVRWSMQQLAALPHAREALDQKVIALVGAVYELATGSVRFLA